MLKIKSDDEVIILAGKDKGKRGKVRRVLDNNKLIVSGVNMVKEAHQAQPAGGSCRWYCRKRSAYPGFQRGDL